MVDTVPVDPEAADPWIDISRPVESGVQVWPGDVPFSLNQRHEGGMVLSSFSTTCHVGTHVDAPKHLDLSAGGVESIPVDRLIGAAEVVVPAKAEVISPWHLPANWAPGFRRVLIRTDSHPVDAPISDGFTGVSAELVHWLANRGVELLGIDSPSVDPFSSEDLPAHMALMERGMTWIEGLDLHEVEAREYSLIALPILLIDADAAPVRAVIRPIKKGL